MSDFLIYKLTSPSGKIYIGQTNNFMRRMAIHKTSSRKCPALGCAIAKYGFDAFTKEILHEGLSIDEANYLEEKLIYEFNCLSPNGYNLQSGGLNFKHSQESIEKMRISQTGKKLTEEQRLKISAFNKGKVVSQETKTKLSIFNKGKKLTQEHCQKMREANLGKKMSAESIEKMRIAKKGVKKPASFSAKMSAFHKGKVVSDDSKLKMSEAKKGKNASQETKAKMSASSAFSKKVIIEGVIYASQADAAKVLNMKHSSLRVRIKSDNFPEWAFYEEAKASQNKGFKKRENKSTHKDCMEQAA